MKFPNHNVIIKATALVINQTVNAFTVVVFIALYLTKNIRKCY